jgi:hypothetical protein
LGGRWGFGGDKGVARTHVDDLRTSGNRTFKKLLGMIARRGADANETAMAITGSRYNVRVLPNSNFVTG